MSETEIVPADATANIARQITEQLAKAIVHLDRQLQAFESLFIQAYKRRVWTTLGYATWFDYVTAELPALRLAPVARRDLVAALTEAGLSTRAIGTALGVDHKTVVNDRRAGGENSPPELEVVDERRAGGKFPQKYGDPAPDPEVVDAELVPDPEPAPKVVGLDGKTYTRTPRDVPAPVDVPPKRRRQTRKKRAETWDQAVSKIEAHAETIPIGTDWLLADATADDLDRMRRLIAALHKSATAALGAEKVAQDAVDRLTTEDGEVGR